MKNLAISIAGGFLLLAIMTICLLTLAASKNAAGQGNAPLSEAMPICVECDQEATENIEGELFCGRHADSI